MDPPLGDASHCRTMEKESTRHETSARVKSLDCTIQSVVGGRDRHPIRIPKNGIDRVLVLIHTDSTQFMCNVHHAHGSGEGQRCVIDGRSFGWIQSFSSDLRARSRLLRLPYLSGILNLLVQFLSPYCSNDPTV